MELFRDFAAAICRPNSTLVTYGYGFGDEHVNRVIEDMLTIPSTHLVVISTAIRSAGSCGLTRRLAGTRRSASRRRSLRRLRTLVDNYLPKPAIDRATFRMAELLRQRYGSDAARPHGDEADATG